MLLARLVAAGQGMGGGVKTTCAVRLCSGGPAASAAEGVG